MRKKNAPAVKLLPHESFFFIKCTFGLFFKCTYSMIKPISFFLFQILFSGVLFFSCQNPAPEPQADTTPQPDTIRINPVSSEGAVPYSVSSGTVYWSAKKAIGIMHKGNINISGGELQVNSGQLFGGSVTFDMSSITVTNMDNPRDKATLESHLKDNDFFNVKKYPEARFEITEILPSSQPAFNWIIRGVLTIKEKSHPVNVPVRMSIADDELRAESVSFIINRTKWDINFRSGILGTAKDQMIEDVVTLSFELVAGKAKND